MVTKAKKEAWSSNARVDGAFLPPLLNASVNHFGPFRKWALIVSVKTIDQRAPISPGGGKFVLVSWAKGPETADSRVFLSWDGRVTERPRNMVGGTSSNTTNDWGIPANKGNMEDSFYNLFMGAVRQASFARRLARNSFASCTVDSSLCGMSILLVNIRRWAGVI